jgi:hypothetical protein
MFCHIFKRRMKGHAERLLKTLLPHGFEGELFLCGEAFKPLLKKELPVHDVALWVRTAEDRTRLCHALLRRGAVAVIDDAQPQALKFRFEGHVIEVISHDVGNGRLEDILHTFELAIYGLGVRCQHSAVVEMHVIQECWQSIWHRHITVTPAYFCLLMMLKPPCLIRTLHRLGQEAAELGFDVHSDEEHRLWEIYWHDYSEDERKTAMDLYFETTVSHKTQHHYHVVRRATTGPVRPVNRTAAAAAAALALQQEKHEKQQSHAGAHGRRLHPRVA